VELRRARLLIVEDDTLLRNNLRMLLEGEPRFDVLAACATAEEALAAIDASCPDLMLTDLGLPGMSGIELIRTVRERWPAVEIMAHTIREDHGTAFAALKAGASGYIVKGATPR